MEQKDLRKLSKEEQRILRITATEAVIKRKQSQAEVSRVFGITEQLISKWVRAYREKGWVALREDKRGKGKHKKKLSKRQKDNIIKFIENETPDKYKLPYLLWSREAVQELIKIKYKIEVSIKTAGDILQDHGYTIKKPVVHYKEEDPDEVKEWKEKKYPEIKARAKKQKAEIHFGDEAGHQLKPNNPRGYSRKGKKIELKQSGKRGKINMISSISNGGKLRFMLFEKRFTAIAFIEFLERLIKSIERKVILIVDNHRVHKCKKVKEWLKKNKEKIELDFLPKYSPRHNPDEFVNQDVKANALRNKNIEGLKKTKKTINGYLRKIQANPEKVKNYFKNKEVSYAAA